MTMDKYSVIFGIGLGFMILGLIFYGRSSLTRGAVSDQEIVDRARGLGMVSADEVAGPTDDEIISRARELGMVFTSEATPAENTEPTVEPGPVAEPEPAAQPEPRESEPAPVTDATQASPAVRSVVTVRIPDGATTAQAAEILKENGVIADESEFAGYFEENSGGSAVKGGMYILPVAGDYDRILDVMLDRL